MFSAGRFSPVGLVMATLIDFRCGSAHRSCVANKAHSATHFHTALPFFICMQKSLSNFRNPRAPAVSTEAETFLADGREPLTTRTSISLSREPSLVVPTPLRNRYAPAPTVAL